MIIFILLLHFFLLLKTQFIAWPEVVSFPYFVTKGFTINKDFIHPYPPFLTYILLAVYKLFGFNLITLKAFSYLLIIISDFLVYIISKKLSNQKKALIILFVYVFVQTFLEGNMLWFDTALVPFLLISFYFLLNKKFLLSSLFIGITVFIKQSALIYLLVFIVINIFSNRKKFIKTNLKIIVFPILFLILVFINFLIKESAVDNVNWLFFYPIKYWGNFPNYLDLHLSKRELFIIFTFLLPIFFMKKNKFKLNLFLMLFASLIAIYPRFSFFHAQALIALSFISLAKVNNKFLIIWFAILFFLLKPYIVFSQFDDRFWNKESINKAAIIDRYSKNTRAYFLGPNSLNYVLSNNVPPKPFIDGFGWYWEVPNLSHSVLLNWDKNMPEYIYWTNPKNGNWYDLATYQNKELTNWIEKNYNKKELVWEETYLWQKKD